MAHRQYITFILILLVIGSPLSAQYVTGIDLLNGRDKVNIPFEFEQGFIMVDIRLNQTVPLRMIFDTGAENIILFEKSITDILGVTYERKIQIMGSDLDSVLDAHITRNIILKADNCPSVSRDIIVLEKNNQFLRQKLGIRVDGIIGGAFFNNLIIKIDYHRERVTLYNPDTFDDNLSKYEEFDIDIVGQKPYLKTKISTSTLQDIETSLLIDTGAALPFLLHANSDPNIVLPERKMYGTVGYGLSGPLKGFLGKTDYLYLGSYIFENIITSYQDIYLTTIQPLSFKRNGILGNLLLSRFTIYIDYPHEKFYIKGQRKYNREFDYDKSGLNILSFGEDLNRFMISSIIPGSPSHAVDLRPGDVILKVNGRTHTGLNLSAITGLLSRKSGKKIKLTILREGNRIKKEFQLSDWYLPTGEFENVE